MRSRHAAAVAAVALAVSGGIPLPATAQADASDLYVSGRLGQCSDASPVAGSQAMPFCTIQAAANVAQPGQTVHIDPQSGSAYLGVNVTRSGTPGAPIVFTGVSWDTQPQVDGLDGHAFNLTGVHDVKVEYLDLISRGTEPVLVQGSSRITLDGSQAWQYGTVPGSAPDVRITGQSNNVTVSRNQITDSHADGVVVDPGVSQTVISTNYISGNPGRGVLVTDAPQTVVTSNSSGGNCASGIELAGDSSGSTVENNVLTESKAAAPSGCTSPDPVDLKVSAASATGTKADYNVVTTETTTPYTWSGLTYADVPSFQHATGQGTHDLTDSPTASVSSAVDSADALAPGELPTDIMGNPRVDDPLVPNTGTGVGYYDRGALELQDPMTMWVAATPSSDSAHLLDATVTGAITSQWGAITASSVDFGDGSTPVSPASFPVNHTYPGPGTYTVTLTATDSAGTTRKQTASVTVGSAYVPLAPARILDTRTGTGAPTGSVSAGQVLRFQVTGRGGVPGDGKVTAVLLNLTATQATDDTHVTAYPGGPVPNASNLNVSAGHDTGNAVLVPVAPDGTVSLYHNSGNVQLIADVQGYYTTAPTVAAYGLSSFTAGSGNPIRVLDTRPYYGIGAPPRMIGPGGTVKVKVRGAGLLPDAAQVAVLNLTATDGTDYSHVTAAPNAIPPTNSSLNFAPGQTVANQVTVPIDPDGTVTLYNNSGSVNLIADLQGYYGPQSSTVGPVLTAATPTRLLDTRNGIGGTNHPLWSQGFVAVKVRGVAGVPDKARAVLVNLTATNPTDDTFLAAGVFYAGDHPATSNLNVTPGATVPNLALVPIGPDGNIYVYNNSGSTDVIVDLEGYTP